MAMLSLDVWLGCQPVDLANHLPTSEIQCYENYRQRTVEDLDHETVLAKCFTAWAACPL